MTERAVVELLKYYPHIPSELTVLAKELAYYEQCYNNIKAPSLEYNPKSGGISDPTGRLGGLIAHYGIGDEIPELEKRIDALKCLQAIIFRELKFLPHHQKMTLCYYYTGIDSSTPKNWIATARAMGKSDRQCRRYRDEGVLTLMKKLEKNEELKLMSSYVHFLAL